MVKPHVNTKMSNVRDIILQNEPFAISSEFQFAPKEIRDDELAEYAKLAAYNLSKGGTEDFPITDNLYSEPPLPTHTLRGRGFLGRVQTY